MRLLLPLLLSAAVVFAEPAASTSNFAAGAVKAKSYSKLAFSPDGILFVGDSIGGRIFALDLGDKTPFTPTKAFELKDLEGKIAALVGADPRDVMVHDMAVNPISKNTYLTVSRGRRSFTIQWQLPNDVANPSVLLRVTPAGAIEEVRLENVKHSSVDLMNPINDTKKAEYKDSKARVDAISDMAFSDGKLYVAGLSNEEFSSAMRVYPFPFDGKGTMTTLEIYHGAHAKYETDSPIRSFLPYTINGKKFIIASYLCTPLVLFPVDDLKDKTHVKGQTIAELGSGNYPVDMVAFKSGGKDGIMVINTTRGPMKIDAADLAKPLPTITAQAEPYTGVKAEKLRDSGLIAAENYGDKFLLTLSRNKLSGELLISTMALGR
jgi:hypothetical protein